MDIGNKLRVLRHEVGYSQQKVADYLNISKSKYCRMEDNSSSPDARELEQIFLLYGISPNDFFGMEFPIRHKLIYPEGILDNFEMEIENLRELTEDWNINRERLNRLRKALEPVLEARNEALDFPELDLSHVPSGTTVKQVVLDIRGERLIKQYFKLEEEYHKVLFGAN